MYRYNKCSPYYRRRYKSKWWPYFNRYYNTYKWSPLYDTYRWSPLYNRYKWSPINDTYWWSPLYNRYKWTPRYYRYLCDKYYNYWSPSYRRYYFDDLYVDLKNKMDMFKTFLGSLPKNRSEMVNDLEIPEDILKNRSYAGVEVDLDDELSSLGSSSSVCSIEELRRRPRSPLSTDSSISLSRAMTSSEIDYDLLRRFKSRRHSDPFQNMKAAIEAFPEEYLVSINDFRNKPSEEATALKRERPLYNESLNRRMQKYFDEECRVFSPDDPGLLDLEDALQEVDLKALDLDLI